MRKRALITGASKGIGLEFAKIHASHGGDLVLVARSKDLLEGIKKDLENKFQINVYLIIKDLTEENSAQEICDELQKNNLQIDYLINNAGMGAYGFFFQHSLENYHKLMQLNMISLINITRLLIPQMIKNQEGKILNVASMAGFIPGPQHAIYYASKAFLISFSEALSEELKGTNVSVTLLCPGATRTDFFNVADMAQARSLQWMSQSAEEVARKGYKALLKNQLMVFPGSISKVFLFLLRFTPRCLTRKISDFMLKNASHADSQ